MSVGSPPHDYKTWEKPPQPMTLERALSFVMPVGKHKGKTLEEIAKSDPAYLEWVAHTFEPQRAITRACKFLVVEGMAGRGFPPK